ncbi:MAG: hypothetical protein ACO35E_02675 [Ilumatobacteraceae bacterium]
MRTTVDIDEANLRAIEALRSESGKGLSVIVNEVLARGLATDDRPRKRFVQRSFPMGELTDVSNIGALLEDLDGPAHR